MTNEDILDELEYCDISQSKELVPGEAYLFKDYFDKWGDFLVLLKDNIKVGGIYRMGDWDMHVVLKEEYRGQHILSNFLKKGIIKKIWPKIKAVDICDVVSQEEFDKKKYLVGLCNMKIRNEQTILDTVKKFGWPKDTYLTEDFHEGLFIIEKEEKDGISPGETLRFLGGYLEGCPK